MQHSEIRERTPSGYNDPSAGKILNRTNRKFIPPIRPGFHCISSGLPWLPPYSPQLNPDEQVWGYVKTRVAKQLPENKDDLKQLLVSVLRRLQKLPNVVSAFFRHPECRYAMA
jgi:hypothetical protein